MARLCKLVILNYMGVLRLIGTILRHPATQNALIENTPVFECLLIDYNANIHYTLHKTITELNEILYFTYHQENNVKTLFLPQSITNLPTIEYNFDLDLGPEDLEDLVDRYNEDYGLGRTYENIRKFLTDERITDIIFKETIKYTKMLICSINKGWIKKVFLALDGTPSMAKIKEQRNRRYISLHINNIKEDIVKKHKFRDANIMQIDLFYYRSMICVGTNLMEKIQQALFNLDIGLDIDVSTVSIKGEGEKKIIHAMDYYTEYNSYCIMSPDSDMLILIGLLSNDPKFSGKQLYNFRIEYHNKNQYQFFDLRQLVSNFQQYYSDKLGIDIPIDKMLDVFFMLVVFGNDFLPKLEPLDVTKHFDLVCEICLNLSMAGNHFIENNSLNYKYLLEFFKIVNQHVIRMAIEQSLNNKYNNYHKLCQHMSVSQTDLENNIHHPFLKPTKITYDNFGKQMKILITAYSKFINFMKGIDIAPDQIMDLYMDMHTCTDDSYLLLVMPKMLRFPGSESITDIFNFFKKLVTYIISTRNYSEIKFRNRLMPKEHVLYPSSQQSTLSAYMSEIEKLNRGLEPYRSVFRIEDIDLVDYNLTNNTFIDLRDKYYETYVRANISNGEIENLVFDYLLGIEWLYQYYISGKHLEWSGWCYNNSRAPLISTIVEFLEKNDNIGEKLRNALASYPENNMGEVEHYLYVTPNEYTKVGVSPNLSDVLHLIDGYGAPYLNKCQIKWHEYGIK